jgi:hypothetical protein
MMTCEYSQPDAAGTHAANIAIARWGSVAKLAGMQSASITATHGVPCFADSAYHPRRDKPLARLINWAW